MISTLEYKKMEFNPTITGSILKAYPKLESIVGKADEKMLRYVLLMYDMNSPLRDAYPDLQERKELAATLAGYSQKDNKAHLFEFKVSVKTVNDLGDIEFKEVPNDELLDIITSYLRYQNNYVWSMMVSNEQAFYEFGQRVMVPVGDGKDKDILQAVDIKKKLMEAQDDIVQRLKKYMRELSGEDDLLEESITKRKRLRPENVSSNRQR